MTPMPPAPDLAQPPCDLADPPKDLTTPPRDCDGDEKKCTTTCVKVRDDRKSKCDRDHDDCYKRSHCNEDRRRCDHDCDDCSHSCEKEHVVCTTTCTNTCNTCKEKR